MGLRDESSSSSRPASHPKKRSFLFVPVDKTWPRQGLDAHGRSNSSRICGLLRVSRLRFSCKKRDEKHRRRTALPSIIDDPACIYGAKHVLKPVLPIGSANRMRHRIRVPTRLHLRLLLRLPGSTCTLLSSFSTVCFLRANFTDTGPAELLSCRRRLQLQAATSATRERDVRMWAGPDSRLTYAIFQALGASQAGPRTYIIALSPLCPTAADSLSRKLPNVRVVHIEGGIFALDYLELYFARKIQRFKKCKGIKVQTCRVRFKIIVQEAWSLEVPYFTILRMHNISLNR